MTLTFIQNRQVVHQVPFLSKLPEDLEKGKSVVGLIPASGRMISGTITKIEHVGDEMVVYLGSSKDGTRKKKTKDSKGKKATPRKRG